MLYKNQDVPLPRETLVGDFAMRLRLTIPVNRSPSGQTSRHMAFWE